MFKAFRLARYSFLFALAGESAFLGVPLTLQKEISSFWLKRTINILTGLALSQSANSGREKTYERGFGKKLLHTQFGEDYRLYVKGMIYSNESSQE